MTTPPTKPSLLFQSTMMGTCVRIFAVCFWLSVVLSLLFGLRYAECLPSTLTAQKITLLFFIGMVPTVIGQVCSEYPSGTGNALLRLATSMSCRTGIPMMAVMVIALRDKSFLTLGVVMVLMLFYGIGMLLGLYLEVGRLDRLTASRSDAC